MFHAIPKLKPNKANPVQPFRQNSLKQPVRCQKLILWHRIKTLTGFLFPENLPEKHRLTRMLNRFIKTLELLTAEMLRWVKP
jgi:seryl-tRNA(Sec) selenium transferase